MVVQGGRTPMAFVIRIDRALSDSDALRPPVKDDNGFLHVEGFVSRAGIYEYINTEDDAKQGLGPVGKVRRELRPDEEVFREDSLSGFAGMSLTDGHPKGRLVTIKNVKEVEVGNVAGSARRVGNKAAVRMVVKNPKSIAKIEARKQVELSPGYKLEIFKTPGVDPKYGPYDVVQRNIMINHLAHVDMARGGHDMSIRTDDADMPIAVEHCDEATLLTSSVDGHQHTICIYGDSAGRTSWSTSETAAKSDPDATHAHSWIRNADGSLTIGEDSGHTHTIESAAVPADPVAVALEVVGQQLDAMLAGGERNDSAHQPRPGDKTMDKDEQIRLLKVRCDEADKGLTERTDAITAQTTRADAAEAALKTAAEKVELLESQLAAGSDAMETEAIKKYAERADALERELAEVKAAQPKLIIERTDVVLKARAVLGDEFRTDGQTNRAIQATVVKKLRPKEDVSDKVSDASLASRFDSLVDDRTRTARSHSRAAEVLSSEHRSETRADSMDSRDGRANAWRNQALPRQKDA